MKFELFGFRFVSIDCRHLVIVWI